MELTPQQQIDLWFHYEEIAMHFNELIIRYRLQLMGGAGAIGAIGLFLAQRDGLADSDRRRYRTMLSGFLFVLILAAGYLDYYYYHQLLQGAVEALLDLEAKNPHIKMSTFIHERVKGEANRAIAVWYASILIPLFFFTLWSAWRYFCPPRTEDD